jgi:hypothetical protein
MSKENTDPMISPPFTRQENHLLRLSDLLRRHGLFPSVPALDMEVNGSEEASDSRRAAIARLLDEALRIVDEVNLLNPVNLTGSESTPQLLSCLETDSGTTSTDMAIDVSTTDDYSTSSEEERND